MNNQAIQDEKKSNLLTLLANIQELLSKYSQNKMLPDTMIKHATDTIAELEKYANQLKAATSTIQLQLKPNLVERIKFWCPDFKIIDLIQELVALYNITCKK